MTQDGAERLLVTGGLEPFGEPVTSDLANAFRGKPLYSGRSDFQKVDVYEHTHFGRVLTLDDLVQTTERDEFCYHEMLVHPALCSRDHVSRVLVIGGGDGGTLRHALMHDANVVMCEIDEDVVRVSREYLPSLSGGAFDDPRAELVIGDGAAYVSTHEDAFDAILVDSTDAVGAAVVLFSVGFYEACHRALRPGGVLLAQTGSPLYQGAEFQGAVRNMAAVFGSVEPYVAFVPTYPGVLWSYTAATDGVPVSQTTPDEVRERLERRGIATRFYTPALHRAAFALPAFVDAVASDATARAAPVPRG